MKTNTNTTMHTPGPWKSKGRFVGTPNHMSCIAECRDICGNWSDDTMAANNARLIGAAPELLEALQDLFGADMAHCMMGDGKDDQIAAIAKARAAIAKATGEQA